ncbi:MAG: Hsp33 family molecular chaperone HslO [Hahellaceae bacterium]|nr:Hsp33 family molecular chaperone HslO [Hahellaceae bacterium]
MTSSDTLTRFLLEKQNIRGEIVVLDQTMAEILSKQAYPPFAAQLLGESAVATLLLSGTLKIEGSTTLQARGDGPLPLLMAEATHDRTVRGIARWTQEKATGSLLDLLGTQATLAITLTPRQGARYQGIVPLEKSCLADCIEDYFRQSEQLRTGLRIFHSGQHWGGILLQELPDPSQRNREAEWEHIQTLTGTLTEQELFSLSAEEVLYRLFHQEEIRLLDRAPVRFACSCSEERTLQAIASMGEAEATSIVEEQGQLEITCQFCHQTYRFSPSNIAQLFKNPSIH